MRKLLPIPVDGAGGCFLMAHGRLVGRIYLVNRERVGW